MKNFDNTLTYLTQKYVEKVDCLHNYLIKTKVVRKDMQDIINRIEAWKLPSRNEGVERGTST